MFDAGRLTAQLVIVDKSRGEVACHVPVSAKSTASLEITITLDQDGREVYDKGSARKLAVDFGMQVDDEVRRALGSIAPR